MPFPFIIAGAAIAAGIYGTKKGIDAYSDNRQANENNDEANSIVHQASKMIEKSRDDCKRAIDDLAQRKIQILNNSIKTFIAEFEKLNHVELSESKDLNELQNLVLDKNSFSELKHIQSLATSMIGGATSGVMAGALTAFGAYSAAGLLASASTGTAIASLSGAAATNATLAFFGGGSLAAGGLGMAGGAAVLGGLVAGPALAVLGVVLSSKASANLDTSYSNLAKAKEFREEMETASLACKGIKKRADMFNEFLLSLNSIFEPLIHDMKDIIRRTGTDYRMFSNDDKKVIAEAMSLAGAIKIILDTPILDQNGKLTDESGRKIEEVKNLLNR